jgi:hypothetical protein
MPCKCRILFQLKKQCNTAANTIYFYELNRLPPNNRMSLRWMQLILAETEDE